MGWLLLPLGSIPGDFWVAEIFPFLASYTNPHFPLSMVCMLWMVFAWIKLEGKVRFLILGAGGLLLAILQPFGNVIMGLVFSLDLIWSILRKEVVFPKWVALGWFALFSLPYMLYTLWIIRPDPVFAIWNEQNVTPLFSLQDAIFTISPGILFACFYIFHAIRNPDQTDRMLILWVIVSIGISLMPITLQRRFLLASYLPMTILGFKYLDHILADRPRVGRLLRTSWFILAIPTNLILVTMSILGVYNQNSILFIRQDVIDGFNWLKVNTRIDANILSGPVTSLYLPAYTGQGVVYGHPYETPNAEQNEEELLGCLRDGFMADCTDLIETQNINYILIGPEEKQTGWKTPAFQYQQVFQAGEVKIYEVAR
jgi:hypothetical protein